MVVHLEFCHPLPFTCVINYCHFDLEKIDKEIVTRKCTSQQLSFEWSHLRISSTDSEVRTTLYNILKGHSHAILVHFKHQKYVINERPQIIV